MSSNNRSTLNRTDQSPSQWICTSCFPFFSWSIQTKIIKQIAKKEKFHNHCSLSGVGLCLIRSRGLQELDPPSDDSLSSSLEMDPVSLSWVSPQSLVDLLLVNCALALEVPDQLLLLELVPGRKTRIRKNTVSQPPSSKEDKALSSLLSSPIEDCSVLIKSPRSLCRSNLLQVCCLSGSASDGRT